MIRTICYTNSFNCLFIGRQLKLMRLPQTCFIHFSNELVCEKFLCNLSLFSRDTLYSSHCRVKHFLYTALFQSTGSLFIRATTTNQPKFLSHKIKTVLSQMEPKLCIVWMFSIAGFIGHFQIEFHQA